MAMAESNRNEAISALQTLVALGFFDSLAQTEATNAINLMPSVLDQDDSAKVKFMNDIGMRLRVFQGLSIESKQVLEKFTDSNGEKK